MKIVPYDKKYKTAFIEMNRQWISEMFVLEEEDIAVLEHFEQSIEQGGQIFFAVDDDDEVLALRRCPTGNGRSKSSVRAGCIPARAREAPACGRALNTRSKRSSKRWLLYPTGNARMRSGCTAKTDL